MTVEKYQNISFVGKDENDPIDIEMTGFVKDGVSWVITFTVDGGSMNGARPWKQQVSSLIGDM